jgi:hypothetical protein
MDAKVGGSRLRDKRGAVIQSPGSVSGGKEAVNGGKKKRPRFARPFVELFYY